MAGFFEDEAELGSENEENDHHIKNINKRDAEEDEEGLDEDLKDFVHIPGDNEEIPDNASDVHRRYMEDLREDDLKFNKKMLEKGLFGRKRKFDDKDEEEEDDNGNLIKKTLEEKEEFMRMKEAALYGDPEAKKVYEEQRKQEERRRLAEEEKLDEEEIERHLKEMDYEKFQREFSRMDRFKQENMKKERETQKQEQTELAKVIDLSKRVVKPQMSEAALSTKDNSKEKPKLNFKNQVGGFRNMLLKSKPEEAASVGGIRKSQNVHESSMGAMFKKKRGLA